MKIICLGNIKENYFKDFIKENSKKKNIEIIEINEIKLPKNFSQKNIDKALEKESELILSRIEATDYVVCLCIEGKEINQEKFNSILKKKNLVFVIGSSYGLDKKIKMRANLKLSFSKMTFPHQLMRVILIDTIKSV